MKVLVQWVLWWLRGAPEQCCGGNIGPAGALSLEERPAIGQQPVQPIEEQRDRVVLDRYKKRVPARLAQIRGERSQRSFARDLGVFQQNVNRYENGTTPHADFLIALALQEIVSLDWLLLGRGRPRRR